jgi:hypothetical protein
MLPAYENYQRLEKQEIPKLEAESKIATEKVNEVSTGIEQVCLLLACLTIAHHHNW